MSSLGGWLVGRSAGRRRGTGIRSQPENHGRVDAEKVASGERDDQRADADAAAPNAAAATATIASPVLDVLTLALVVQTHASPPKKTFHTGDVNRTWTGFQFCA
jgi:hypothetical protein